MNNASVDKGVSSVCRCFGSVVREVMSHRRQHGILHHEVGPLFHEVFRRPRPVALEYAFERVKGMLVLALYVTVTVAATTSVKEWMKNVLRGLHQDSLHCGLDLPAVESWSHRGHDFATSIECNVGYRMDGQVFGVVLCFV